MAKPTETRPRRQQRDLTRLRRSPAQSHARTQRDRYRRLTQAGERPLKRLRDFLSIMVAEWTYHYLKSRFGKRHAFQDYDYAAGETGLYQMGKGEVRLSLVADWATGTREAQTIAERITRFKPHFTIHLGDTYYVGAEQEIQENFFSLVDWPEGSRGSFALPGNHEMYAKGKAYFETLLPTLGLRDPRSRKPQGQKASFFCLENKYWRMIGLDTGYNSVRRIPLSEKILPPSCKLPDPLLRWLTDTVKPSADHRGLILLSHHQYYSAFEDCYQTPARQLAQFVSRPVLWFWGHEHRLALYGKSRSRGGIEAYGRCIGHGGMPIEDYEKRPNQSKAQEFKLVAYDARRQGLAGSVEIGYNGFLNLTFRRRRLAIDYRDIDGRSLLTETWEVDRATRKLRGIGIKQKVDLHVPTGLNLMPLSAAQS